MKENSNQSHKIISSELKNIKIKSTNIHDKNVSNCNDNITSEKAVKDVLEKDTQDLRNNVSGSLKKVIYFYIHVILKNLIYVMIIMNNFLELECSR